MKSHFRAAALAAVLSAIAAAGAQAATSDAAFAATTLNVSADGETQVAPDKATINLGVETKAPSAAAAMAENARRMNAIIAALHGAGVDAKDILTSNLSLNPQYDYAPNMPPRLDGYQASNQVTITVQELSRLGPTIDAVTNAGANQINGISFGLKSTRAAEDAARSEAVKALKAKADLYAEASGYHVARLVNLSEGGAPGYRPIGPAPMMMAKAAVHDVPVAPGDLTVRVSVSAVYELAR
ncbi:MAG TPA: SIMPL domain-containing protein [Caulobacteraceae bacterium]|nr:SIMPL domain-containing protein [Caulobacteraceae bacterium]